MANITLGFPNRIGEATVSGGNYFETMPLPNIQTRAFAQAARTVDRELASTQFVLDFGRRRSLRILALVAHNLSLSARYVWEASNVADFSTLAFSQAFDAWPRLAGGTWDIHALNWLSNNFWLGGYTQEDIEGQTPVSSQVLPQNVMAQYWRCRVFDRTNKDGFIQIGRVFTSEVFLQPRINMKWGATLGYEDSTTVSTALNGAEFFDVREPIRILRFTLGYLSKEEGYAKALELTRRAGISGEVFVIFDPDDTTFAGQRNFIGRLRQLSPLESIQMFAGGSSLTSMAFEIKELR